jgi:vitamin B12 transporter
MTWRAFDAVLVVSVVCLLLPRSAHAFDGGAPLDAGLPIITSRAPDASSELNTAEPTLQVTVRSSRAQAQRESAQAVSVLELGADQPRTADLGEVLARTSGVNVRRTGGLGSSTAFMLNGLTGNQIRFFLDGVPLYYAGHPLGFANVPVGLLERLVIYRGVVPISFGTDALGGAVDLVTDENLHRNRAQLSYQGGSWGTHRGSLAASYYHAPSRVFVRGSAFVDRADNDYPIDVETAGPNGLLRPARVHRFHDGYRAEGAELELGALRQRWAEQLRVRGFYTQYGRDIQNDALMRSPYGEATYERRTYGLQLRLKERFGARTQLNGVLGVAQVETGFRDLSRCRYDWYGRCVAALPQPGEIQAVPTDISLTQQAIYARLVMTSRLHEQHKLRIALTPTFHSQIGENRSTPVDVPDALRARRNLLTGLLGAEYEANSRDERFSNILFVKFYLQTASTVETLNTGLERDLDRRVPRIGAGNALRFLISERLYAKASYEYATRMPTPEELFGDGALTVENLHLAPEKSHNVNVGAWLDGLATSIGSLRGYVSGFGRFTDDLIFRMGGLFFRNENVLEARTLGFESGAGITLPSEILSLDGTLTWLSTKNVSGAGEYARYEGQQIPNQPQLTASGSARLKQRGIGVPNDELELLWDTRYVGSFARAPSPTPEGQLRVPDQLTHTLGLSYVVNGKPIGVRNTIELQNLTNAKVQDFYGVQRPGRSVFFKTILTL